MYQQHFKTEILDELKLSLFNYFVKLVAVVTNRKLILCLKFAMPLPWPRLAHR